MRPPPRQIFQVLRRLGSAIMARAPRSGRPLAVSLTMIVRDEEKSLPRCLASVRGLFDEIIIVDTGSTDRTKDIARWFGAKVFDFEWIDDFAAARNAALDHATGDYAFWLDADDVISHADRKKLEDLLHNPPHPGAAYVFSLVLDHPNGLTKPPGGQIRLFPRIPEVR